MIFNELLQRVATDNNKTEPRNVTLKLAKLTSRRHKKAANNESSESNQELLSSSSIVNVSPDKSPNKPSLLGFFKK